MQHIDELKEYKEEIAIGVGAVAVSGAAYLIWRQFLRSPWNIHSSPVKERLPFDANGREHYAGQLIAHVFQNHNVKQVFTLTGGHIAPILVGSKELGIRVVDVSNNHPNEKIINQKKTSNISFLIQRCVMKRPLCLLQMPFGVPLEFQELPL